MNIAIGLLSNDRICSASNRAYYSIFRAIHAVHALSGNQYISSETFPRIYGKKMHKLMHSRKASDYENIMLDKFEVQEYIGFAKSFCGGVKDYCEKELDTHIDVEELLPLEQAITAEWGWSR